MAGETCGICGGDGRIGNAFGLTTTCPGCHGSGKRSSETEGFRDVTKTKPARPSSTAASSKPGRRLSKADSSRPRSKTARRARPKPRPNSFVRSWNTRAATARAPRLSSRKCESRFVPHAERAAHRAKPAVGFSDCLVLEAARKAGHLPLGTFDRDLGKLNGVVRL